MHEEETVEVLELQPIGANERKSGTGIEGKWRNGLFRITSFRLNQQIRQRLALVSDDGYLSDGEVGAHGRLVALLAVNAHTDVRFLRGEEGTEGFGNLSIDNQFRNK